MKVVLNTVSRRNLRSLDSATLDATVFQRRIQSSRNADLAGFGIDVQRWWPSGSNGDRKPDRTGACRSRIRKNPPDYMHFGKVTVGDDDNPLKRPVWASRLQFAPD